MTTTELHLQQLKWPIEYLMVQAKVRDYTAPSTDAKRREHLDVWDKNSVVTTQTYNVAGQSVLKSQQLATLAAGTTGVTITTGVLTGTAELAVTVAPGDILKIGGKTFIVSVGAAAGDPVTSVTVSPGPAVAVTAATGAELLTLQGTEIQTKRLTPILDTISVKAHGIDIYKEMPAGFFNAYTTYHYGGQNINAPSDPGSLFIPFCLYPGTYQPSGHINVSRAREFYLYYTSAYQDANPDVVLWMVVLASAINFLLISDGSAVLRYST